MAANKDPVKLALTYVTRLADVVEGCRKEICEKAREGERCRPGAGIARRANDLPGLVASVGLVPALTFYMSKADRELLNKFIEILENEGYKPDNSFCEKAAEELGWKEKAGYTAMLAVAARGLADLEYLHLQQSGNQGAEDAMKRLASGLRELRSSYKEVIAERRMLELLTEVKKLAAAFFKQEED